MSKGNVTAVVGAQLGSEGKGVIISAIADKYQVHVRTGGPNAGHTFWHNGQVFMHQTVPIGWINPAATLIIGRGALIDVETLIKEIETICAVDPTIVHRLKIDRKAGVISGHHYLEEGGVHGEMHKRIGSTGKGVGAARRDRLMRDPEKFFQIDTVADAYKSSTHGWELADLLVDDTPKFLHNAVNMGANVLLEGAQGSGLSLIHGPWPYCTSNDTNAAQMAADCGLAPQYVTDVLLVARTYPIRVAGNSGPLSNETSWSAISERVGKPVEEKTTVTKKIRRVGEWDETLLDDAIVLNGSKQVAVTFMDYLDPKSEGVSNFDKLGDAAQSFVTYVERRFNVEVVLVGTGGTPWQVCTRTDAKWWAVNGK